MNNCELIKGICTGDFVIKAKVRSEYFQITRDLIEVNNKKNKVDIKSRYIFDNVIGLINMKFTSRMKSNHLEKLVKEYNFEHLIYYLSKCIYISEFNIQQITINSHIIFEDSKTFSNNNQLDKDFGELINIRENELKLVYKLMNNSSLDEFKNNYFDMAIDIINKNKRTNTKIHESEIHEHAKDIFWEAVSKLISLIQAKKYIYEAKISSFLYWPMYNKWIKISKDSGINSDMEIIQNHIESDENIYYENNVEKDEIKKFLLDNFHKLGEKEKQVLWLKEAEGYSYQEIKEKLNLPEEINYLKQIKLRAKRFLASKLKEDKRFNEIFS